MTGYDAIVIGAGHNGLTAAVLLQRAGLRTACLDAKRYAGGMASTVELFDGYRFEIAGSVQFPTSSAVSSELGLDSLPTVDLEVMSVALRGVGDDPVVQFTDPTKMLTHLHRVHGADAVTGMAGLLAWSQAPTRALGRFEAGTLPKSFDEMYACATNEFERSAIDDMLFGSVTDVLDRHFPDREKHGARARLRIGCPGGRLRAVEEIARWHRRAYHPSVAIAGTHRRRGPVTFQGDRDRG